MISMESALTLLSRRLLGPKHLETVPLAETQGRVLAESIRSDIDLPPFHRVAMDGYAVRAADLSRGEAVLEVEETVHAGEVAVRRVRSGAATRIMTGAPLPPGADAVVMVERTEEREGGGAVHIAHSPEPGEHVCSRGEDLRKGSRVLGKGTRIGAAEAGILAMVGRASVEVARRPRVTILSTGDELVEPGQPLGPGQIRNSNAYTLAHLVRAFGGEPVVPGIVRDDRRSLRRHVKKGLEGDLALLSGGVSMGAKDFVPGILAEEGVKAAFHRVAIKPAKPIYFGRTRDCLVFGLPGNPVSSYVAFLVFVVPALRRRQGLDPGIGAWPQGSLAEPMRSPPRLTEFRPVRVERVADRHLLHPVRFNGSGHLAALVAADGFAVLPEGAARVPKGRKVSFVPVPRGDV